MEWVPAGQGTFELTFPDGSAAGYTRGGAFSFTLGHLFHRGREYRLRWGKVWQGGRHLLTARPHGQLRIFLKGLSLAWRAARDDRMSDPLVVETGRASLVESGAELVLARHGRWHLATDADGREVAAVHAGSPHAVRVRPLDEEAVAVLLVLTRNALALGRQSSLWY